MEEKEEKVLTPEAFGFSKFDFNFEETPEPKEEFESISDEEEVDKKNDDTFGDSSGAEWKPTNFSNPIEEFKRQMRMQTKPKPKKEDEFEKIFKKEIEKKESESKYIIPSFLSPLDSWKDDKKEEESIETNVFFPVNEIVEEVIKGSNINTSPLQELTEDQEEFETEVPEKQKESRKLRNPYRIPSQPPQHQPFLPRTNQPIFPRGLLPNHHLGGMQDPRRGGNGSTGGYGTYHPPPQFGMPFPPPSFFGGRGYPLHQQLMNPNNIHNANKDSVSSSKKKKKRGKKTKNEVVSLAEIEGSLLSGAVHEGSDEGEYEEESKNGKEMFQKVENMNKNEAIEFFRNMIKPKSPGPNQQQQQQQKQQHQATNKTEKRSTKKKSSKKKTERTDFKPIKIKQLPKVIKKRPPQQQQIIKKKEIESQPSKEKEIRKKKKKEQPQQHWNNEQYEDSSSSFSPRKILQRTPIHSKHHHQHQHHQHNHHHYHPKTPSQSRTIGGSVEDSILSLSEEQQTPNLRRNKKKYYNVFLKNLHQDYCYAPIYNSMFDEAKWMSKRNIARTTQSQLRDLLVESPLVDDYYFTTYMARKENNDPHKYAMKCFEALRIQQFGGLYKVNKELKKIEDEVIQLTNSPNSKENNNNNNEEEKEEERKTKEEKAREKKRIELSKRELGKLKPQSVFKARELLRCDVPSLKTIIQEEEQKEEKKQKKFIYTKDNQVNEETLELNICIENALTLLPIIREYSYGSYIIEKENRKIDEVYAAKDELSSSLNEDSFLMNRSRSSSSSFLSSSFPSSSFNERNNNTTTPSSISTTPSTTSFEHYNTGNSGKLNVHQLDRICDDVLYNLMCGEETLNETDNEDQQEQRMRRNGRRTRMTKERMMKFLYVEKGREMILLALESFPAHPFCIFVFEWLIPFFFFYNETEERMKEFKIVHSHYWMDLKKSILRNIERLEHRINYVLRRFNDNFESIIFRIRQYSKEQQEPSQQQQEMPMIPIIYQSYSSRKNDEDVNFGIRVFLKILQVGTSTYRKSNNLGWIKNLEKWVGNQINNGTFRAFSDNEDFENPLRVLFFKEIMEHSRNFNPKLDLYRRILKSVTHEIRGKLVFTSKF